MSHLAIWFSTKGSKICTGKKADSSTIGTEKLDIHLQKNRIRSLSLTHTKMYQKLNAKPKALNWDTIMGSNPMMGVQEAVFLPLPEQVNQSSGGSLKNEGNYDHFSIPHWAAKAQVTMIKHGFSAICWLVGINSMLLLGVLDCLCRAQVPSALIVEEFVSKCSLSTENESNTWPGALKVIYK